MNRVSEQILSAAEIIAQEMVSNLNYDKTIQALIYSLENVDTGEYKVKYNSNIFSAYSEDLEAIYSTQDNVFVRVPEGDFSNRKTIISKVVKDSLTAAQLTALLNTIKDISPSFDSFYGYNKSAEYGVIAGRASGQDGLQRYIYPIQDSEWGSNVPSLLDTNTAHDRFRLYSQTYELILIQASFLTTFHLVHTLGNYGIEVEFFTKDPNTTVRYILDHNAFNGDPYHLSTYSPQSVIVRVQTNYLQGVKSIRLFEENFLYDVSPTGTTITSPNIFVKDINIQYVERLDLSSTTYYLTISPLDGSAFTTTTRSLRLQGQLIYQGKNILTKDSCVCTWFKRDLTMMPGLTGYDKDVGFGWRKVESSNSETISSDGSLLTLTNYNTLLHEGQYKLKVVYNRSITTLADIEIFNLRDSYDYSLELVTTNDNIELQLTGNTSTTGIWYYSYPDGTYLQYDGSNKHSSILVKDILLYSAVTFYCTVYNGNNILGTLEHTIFNSESLDDVIISYNGEDNFRYDANGDVTIEGSERDRTLTVSLAWKEGIGTSYDIAWLMRDSATGQEILLPTTYASAISPASSMMEGVWLDTTQNLLHYHIRLKYKVNCTNNTLLIRITTLDEKVYTFEKEIIFLKDGDQGTNGTTYVITVRPYDSAKAAKKTGFSALRYRNGVWSDPMLLKCFVYKDGVPIDNTNSNYTILYSWQGVNVLLNGTSRLNGTSDQVIARGTGTISVSESTSADKEHYVKIEVTIVDKTSKALNKIYAYYPIDVIVGSSLNASKVNIDDLPLYIKYTTSGVIPSTYSNKLSFEYDELDYTSSIKPLNKKLLDISNDYYLVPTTSFIFERESAGDSNIAVLKCSVGSEYILHSIVMFLDTYGNEAINGWDGTALEIDPNKQYVFAPLIGAGEKNSFNQFTGVVMGKDSSLVDPENENRALVGLYGYQDGTNTFGLMQDGRAYFGAADAGGRIYFDGRYATIYGGETTVDRSGRITRAENGMALILADRSSNTSSLGVTKKTVAITIGKDSDSEDDLGVFEVNYAGEVIAHSARINGEIWANIGRIGGGERDRDGWFIDTNRIYAEGQESHVEFYSGEEDERAVADGEYYRIWAGGDDPSSFRTPFKVSSKGRVWMTEADISGTIYATGGLIGCTIDKDTGDRTGGWEIAENLINSNEEEDANYVALNTAREPVHDWNVKTDSERKAGYYRIWAGAVKPSEAPFAVTSTGWIYAANAYITGKIYAQEGLIGCDDNRLHGWIVKTYLLYSEEGDSRVELYSGKEDKYLVPETTDEYYRIWAGGDDPRVARAPFKVTSKGRAFISEADISGKLYATDGLIGCTVDRETGDKTGGWRITADLISSTTDDTGVYLNSGINGRNGYRASDHTYGGRSVPDQGYYRIWAGSGPENPNEAVTAITSTGWLFSKNALIDGVIYAQEGRIGSDENGQGGWTIENDRIYSDAKGNDRVEINSGERWAADFKFKNGNISKTIIDKEKENLSEEEEQMNNYVRIWAGSTTPSNAKFIITKSGIVYAQGAYIDGTINSEQGLIGGWTITKRSFYYLQNGGLNSIGISNGEVADPSGTRLAFWVGKALIKDGIAYSDGALSDKEDSASLKNRIYFYVTNQGQLYCRQAVIEGKISATSGYIGTVKNGWQIGSNGIYHEVTNASGETTVDVKITPSEIFGAYINGGTLSVGGGNLYADNRGVSVSGLIHATSFSADEGSIGGWTIGTYNITKDDIEYGDLPCLYSGNALLIGGAVGAILGAYISGSEIRSSRIYSTNYYSENEKAYMTLEGGARTTTLSLRWDTQYEGLKFDSTDMGYGNIYIAGTEMISFDGAHKKAICYNNWDFSRTTSVTGLYLAFTD